VALEVEGESSASEGGGGGGAWRGTGLREGDTKGTRGGEWSGPTYDDNICFFLVVGLSPEPLDLHHAAGFIWVLFLFIRPTPCHTLTRAQTR
jgi:hypothetical protein